jgi:hypothetical protein
MLKRRAAIIRSTVRMMYRDLIDGLHYGYPLCCVLRFVFDTMLGRLRRPRGLHFRPGSSPLWAWADASRSEMVECGTDGSWIACEVLHFPNRALTDLKDRRATRVKDYVLVTP